MSDSTDWAVEQLRHSYLCLLIHYSYKVVLPGDKHEAQTVAAQAPLFALLHDDLYFVAPKQHHTKRCVVPLHMREKLVEEHHSGPIIGHFSGDKLYHTPAVHWWGQVMYSNVIKHCMSCPQCAMMNLFGKVNRPPLHPIPVSRLFQIIGVDTIDLLLTKFGNCHVVFFRIF